MTRDSGKEVLRQIIEGLGGVTPGPWYEDGRHVFIDTRSPVCCGRGALECCGNPDFEGDYYAIAEGGKKNIPHIARCHPDAIRAIAAYVDELRAALESIAANTCCDRCQEAALVARAALNETAGAFLSEDGEGGFAAGVSRMADEIDRLRAALSAAPSPVTVEGGGNAVPQTLDEIIENSLRMWYFNYDPSLDHTAARIAMREIIKYVIDVARVSPASPSPVDSRDDRDFEWTLVPIKPTLEMAEKGAEAFSLPHPQSVGAENERAALIYRLMLSAALSLPENAEDRSKP